VIKKGGGGFSLYLVGEDFDDSRKDIELKM